ncbi:MAG TPA: DUF2235 domain-containing protein [Thermoanaerobaculia bacterium]|nr:DUF2235 domain-containing protein [Thermoanaerobaculia bacterium]
MKRLIVCCDGTWNRADQEKDDVPCPTNVLKIAYRIAKRDGATPQITYYDQGVGTGNVVDRYSGGAFGEGLEDNILDGYRFLVANYEEGDEIFLFGFSRGAYTARSLGGMMRKCGILRRDAVKSYRAAINLYHDSGVGPDHASALDFRKKNSVVGEKNIEIQCIGIWDTVGSLGIPLRGLRALTRGKHQFHDTELSGSVKNAFHALAIDEHRAPFEPTLWDFVPKPPQRIEQAWFCGAHSDVGGGYPETGLSDYALQWMMDRTAEAGLVFDKAVMQALPLKPSSSQEIHNSKNGLYRVTPGIDRPIGLTKKGQADPTQSVHDSVRAKWDGYPKYRPGPLKDYFKRSGDPRGALQ